MSDHLPEIMATVRRILEDKAAKKGADVSDIQETTNFIDAGLLDSLEFIELITAVEQQHGVVIDFSPYEPDEFSTVAGFARCAAGLPHA
jgi:acyl carrier protein